MGGKGESWRDREGQNGTRPSVRVAGKAARDCQGMSEVICRRGWGRGEKLIV